MGLAEKIQFPIIADPLSQLRSGEHNENMIIDAYDAFLRNEEANNELKPDFIIRFGAMPVSKALTIFLKENRQQDNSSWMVEEAGEILYAGNRNGLLQ